MRLNKVVIAPDSFKGALSSPAVADVIAEEVSAAFPGCEIVKLPVADGGEGSVDTILAVLGGNTYEASVISPDDREITAKFGIAANGAAAIEMAQSSGFTRQNGLHPMTSSTYGFGQLILAALDLGARDFILAIGGSATTDGGCGMAAALGVMFTDSDGNNFIPCGGTLEKIADIRTDSADSRIKDSRFTVMCDVRNPLFGEDGAAYRYAPQKGANSEQVAALDRGLRRLGTLLFERLDRDFASAEGAGAAGGLGAGCMAFLGARLMSGGEAILELCGFERHINGADLIITGEGKLDEQSFNGKVLSAILRHAGNIPVCSICGVCECDEEILRRHGLLVFETSEGISVKESMSDPMNYLRLAARRAMRAFKERS